MSEREASTQQSESPIRITEKKLRIYKRYCGENYCLWERNGATAEEYATLSDKEWSAIAELTQRLYLSKAGLSAPSFVAETEQMLAELAATPEATALLRELAV